MGGQLGIGLTHLALMHSIQALLSAPNPDDPLDENVAKLWKDNEVEAVATGERQTGLDCRPGDHTSAHRSQLLSVPCSSRVDAEICTLMSYNLARPYAGG